MSVPGWPEQLARFQAAPAEAFEHVVDEYVAVALDGDHTRVWLAEPATAYPRLEEFFVAAPDCVMPKQRAGFEARWHGHADERLLAPEQAAHDAVAVRGAA
ncbi:hypothetical protein ABZ894_00465 [Nocardia beijingensis]|uniref:hypothetical protein n=1 Tax=Nocardia beijingensis TaxID=95162 RepID=UPI0033F8EE5C